MKINPLLAGFLLLFIWVEIGGFYGLMSQMEADVTYLMDTFYITTELLK